MGDFNPLKAVGDAIGGAINTVENVGKAATDLVSGNVGGAIGDLGQAGASLVSTAAKGFLATQPELGAGLSKLGPIANMLTSVLGQAGGFNPAQGCGNPSPFNLGGILGGILGNPFGNIFGGGGLPGLPGLPGFPGFPGGGGITGGTPPTGGGAGGAGGAGGPQESWAQLQQDMQAAAKSGDPMQMLQAQQKIDAYKQTVNLLAAVEKANDDMLEGIIQKIA